MKIVIEIPEKTNAHIRSDYGHGVKGLEYEDMLMLCDAVYHGEPYHNRPHGEWVKKDVIDFGMCWATCSVCNKVSRGEAHDNGFGYDYFYPNFCPNCGADMREGERN